MRPLGRSLRDLRALLDDLQARDSAFRSLTEAAEHYLHAFQVDHLALRPSVVYGPGHLRGSAQFMQEWIERAAVGGPVTIPAGDEQDTWSYVEDVAEAFSLAVRATNLPERHIFNIGGDFQARRTLGTYLKTLVPDAQITITTEVTEGNYRSARHRNSRIAEALEFHPPSLSCDCRALARAPGRRTANAVGPWPMRSRAEIFLCYKAHIVKDPWSADIPWEDLGDSPRIRPLQEVQAIDNPYNPLTLYFEHFWMSLSRGFPEGSRCQALSTSLLGSWLISGPWTLANVASKTTRSTRRLRITPLPPL